MTCSLYLVHLFEKIFDERGKIISPLVALNGYD